MAKKLLLGSIVLVAAVTIGGFAWLMRPPRAVSTAPSASAGSRVAVPLPLAEVVYDGKLSSYWEDWGWGPHQLPKDGPMRVVFGGYGGLILGHGELPARFGGVTFRYQAPPSWPLFLSVYLKRAESAEVDFPRVQVQARHVATLEDGWKEVFIEWRELNPKNLPVDRLAIVARSLVGSDWVLLDKIAFTKWTEGSAPPAPVRDVDLAVQCDGETKPISPWIYGAAQADGGAGLFAHRIGGNPLTRLNWDLGDTWNVGSDWFFQNQKIGGGLWEWLDSGARDGVRAAVVVPMIGWVAKDATSVGFPTSKFGKQKSHDPHRPEAGDGFRPDGTKIAPGPPTETSVEASPETIGRWVRMLRDKETARGGRTVDMFILDNEPSLWNHTHRDVHPEALGYDELLDRTLRYGAEVRKAAPDALIAGPAEWGWTSYTLSARDQEAGWFIAPDRRAHGGKALVPWYLQQLAEYEKTHGTRLLDVLDLHFYPAAEGVFGANAHTDAKGAELRLRSTRALWDPTYADESWIKEAVQLIPRMKAWVANNYPGTKTSIGEWSFGGDQHISGGLATAEALGRFGQQGLDYAFYWGGPKKDTATFWAFRAFRNFDGKGGRFLDISVPTREGERVSLFASEDADHGRLVAVIVNRDPVFAVRAAIRLEACGPPSAPRLFSYGQGSMELVANADVKVTDNAVTATVQPYSFSVLELRRTRR